MKKFFQNIFSVKNLDRHKVLTIFGIKFKFISKKYINTLSNELNNKNYTIDLLYDENKCLTENYINLMLKNNTCNNVYLLNDTRRNINHIGCSLVYENLEKLCNKYNLNIFFADSMWPRNDINIGNCIDIIKMCDVVLFNGEGTLHDCAGINMLEKCKLAKEMGKKVFLINTVWQNNLYTEKYLEYFDLIACRESLSFDTLPEKYKNKALIVPDLTFYNKIKNHNEGKLTKIIFTDSVLPDVTEKLKYYSQKYNAEFFYLYLSDSSDAKYLTEEYISNLSNDSLIITGRFHALTLGMKYQIPTIAYPSNTHKIQGLLKDSGLLEYCINDFYNFESQINNFIKTDHSSYIEKSRLYSIRAKDQIEQLFMKVREVL